ncbi:hypothetical protein [Streptomyces sp. NEAU-NA10]|uniref:hypothetical protein n=1 Tax=Streptomyces sp. NEAU-NA10 TaxID=3416050 RepID=UPI003CC5184F
MFSITVSRSLTVDHVVGFFEELIPAGLQLVVQPDDVDIPDNTGDLWIRLVGNEDPAWPLSLDVVGGYDCGLGPYPDLRAAEHMGERLGVDVLCGVDPDVVDVDHQDPYHRLVLVGGQWYLASVAFTRLMGPDWAGSLHDEPVKLIRPVVVRTRQAAPRPRGTRATGVRPPASGR